MEEESVMEVRKNAWMEEFDKVMEKICDEEGNVKNGTLSAKQQR